MCKDRFPDEDWIVTDMRTLCLARHFDGILAVDSFFHLCPEDQRRMFPIFSRHAGKKSALMFTSGPSHGEATAPTRVNHFTTGAWMEKNTARFSSKTASMSCRKSSKTLTAASRQSGLHRSETSESKGSRG